jgi:hypothetical protein
VTYPPPPDLSLTAAEVAGLAAEGTLARMLANTPELGAHAQIENAIWLMSVMQLELHAARAALRAGGHL